METYKDISQTEITSRYPIVTEITENLPWAREMFNDLSEHSPFTGAHSGRVATLAAALASEVNTPAANWVTTAEPLLLLEDIKAVKKAALLHDVGKLYITSKGLETPYEIMSDIDRFHLQNHPLYSYLLVRQYDFETAKILVAHHEFQGNQSGPRSPLNKDSFIGEERRTSLKPQERLSQIIIVISDSVDAALSERPYRPVSWVAPTSEELHGTIANKLPREYHYLIKPAIDFRLAMK